MNNNIMSGKGDLNSLEQLHGNITKTYVKIAKGIIDDVVESEGVMLDYEKAVEQTIQGGGSADEVVRPSVYIPTKDTLAFLKQAQGFLKENDIQVDMSSGNTTRKIRSNIKDLLVNL